MRNARDIVCWECQQVGHYRHSCPTLNQQGLPLGSGQSNPTQ
jgi:hypothetical protein